MLRHTEPTKLQLELKKEEDGKKPEEGKTISGISSKFEYICKVINIIILKLTMLLCSIIGDW